MKIKILPEPMAIANADRGDRSLSSYVNACIMKCHGECTSTKILADLENYLERVIEVCHVTKEHNAQYDVVKSRIALIKKKYKEN